MGAPRTGISESKSYGRCGSNASLGDALNRRYRHNGAFVRGKLRSRIRHVHPADFYMSQTHFTDEQKLQFFRDGYIVIKNAVSREISQKAKDLISNSLPKDERKLLVPPELATNPAVIGLFNDSCLAEIMRNEMGKFPDVISCQVAVTPGHNLIGGKPGPHVDGSWGGKIPTRAEDVDPVKGRPRDPAKYYGENEDLRGTNDGQLWLDPDRRISLGSYTALVGVCLNDQTKPGAGQFGVMKGLHEEVEKVFQHQRDSGSVIGPDGEDWPRMMANEDGTVSSNGIPHSVRRLAHENAKSEGRTATEDWPWPELTPVVMEQGDAVIAMHALPHTATPNLSPNPRMNVYFRIRRWREGNPHENTRRLAHGVSDHLDRGYYGQFLEYPDGYDPWQTSIDKMCDHWSEWDGLQELAANRK